MELTGLVLDLYDDSGRVLCETIKKAGVGLPEKLAACKISSLNELDRLPDRLFGLVATCHGKRFRKYAMHDPMHAATSIAYFLERGGCLPDEVQQKVASNLLASCKWYGLQEPEALVKIAFLGKAVGAGMGILEAASKAKEVSAKNTRIMNEFRKAQAAGTKVAGREVELSPEEERAVQHGEGPAAGYITELFSAFSDPNKTHRKLQDQAKKIDQPDTVFTKKADLNGTEIMPYGTKKPKSKTELAPKVASWVEVGDLSSAKLKQAKAASPQYSFFALPNNRYPIDTEGLVKQAEYYFNENFSEFAPEERRAFAQNLVLHADDLGVKVAGRVLDYCGNDYGPFIDSELTARCRSFEGTGHEVVYSLLLEKRSSIPPMVMTSYLIEADRDTGAAETYGRPGTGFRDPFAAVYGGPKLAEAKEPKEEYSWSKGGDYTSALSLNDLAKSETDLDETFGEGFSARFREDPVGVFKSVPDPKKVVLSRLSRQAVRGNQLV